MERSENCINTVKIRNVGNIFIQYVLKYEPVLKSTQLPMLFFTKFHSDLYILPSATKNNLL